MVKRTVSISALVLMFIVIPVAAHAVTIQHLEHAGKEMEAWMQERVKAFEAQTGIKVEVAHSEPGKVQERLIVQMAANIAPDTTWLSVDRVANIEEVVIDVAPFIARDAVDTAQIPVPLVKNVTVEKGPKSGMILGLPQSAWTVGAAYNKDILDESGLAVPSEDWTWDDLLTYVRTTSKDLSGDGALDQFGLTLPLAWTRLGTVLHHGGGAWLQETDDGLRSAMTTPKTRRALEFIDELYRSGASQLWGNFTEGTAALSYSAGPNEVELVGGKFEFGWVPFAKGPANNGGELAPQFYGIVKGSAHPEEAWEWIKFLTLNMESQLSYARHTGRIPSYIPAAQEYVEQRAQVNPTFHHVIDLIVNPDSYVRPLWQPIANIVADWVRASMIRRQVSLEEALIQAETQINAEVSTWK